MQVYEAMAILRQKPEKEVKHLLDHIKKNGKVLPWVANEIKYLDVQPIKFSECITICRGGIAAEAEYNGTGGEEDISFNQAVKNYERG